VSIQDFGWAFLRKVQNDEIVIHAKCNPGFIADGEIGLFGPPLRHSAWSSHLALWWQGGNGNCTRSPSFLGLTNWSRSRERSMNGGRQALRSCLSRPAAIFDCSDCSGYCSGYRSRSACMARDSGPRPQTFPSKLRIFYKLKPFYACVSFSSSVVVNRRKYVPGLSLSFPFGDDNTGIATLEIAMPDVATHFQSICRLAKLCLPHATRVPGQRT
jgi:hypothetical protein